jgi:hypothetical protein
MPKKTTSPKSNPRFKEERGSRQCDPERCERLLSFAEIDAFAVALEHEGQYAVDDEGA